MKRRRMLIATPALWLAAGASLAQTPARPARIGVLGSVPYETWPLVHPEYPGANLFLPELKAAAQGLGLELRQVVLRSPDELDSAFAALARAGQIAALVAEQRLPAVSYLPQLTRAGVLMSYHSSLDDTVRRLAYYIDRILKGTPAGELPVEQATRFYTTLNLRTAKALGLTLPQSLLLQADEVIE